MRRHGPSLCVIASIEVSLSSLTCVPTCVRDLQLHAGFLACLRPASQRPVVDPASWQPQGQRGVACGRAGPRGRRLFCVVGRLIFHQSTARPREGHFSSPGREFLPHSSGLHAAGPASAALLFLFYSSPPSSPSPKREDSVPPFSLDKIFDFHHVFTFTC